MVLEGLNYRLSMFFFVFLHCLLSQPSVPSSALIASPLLATHRITAIVAVSRCSTSAWPLAALLLHSITVRPLTALLWAAFSLSASLPLTAGASS